MSDIIKRGVETSYLSEIAPAPVIKLPHKFHGVFNVQSSQVSDMDDGRVLFIYDKFDPSIAVTALTRDGEFTNHVTRVGIDLFKEPPSEEVQARYTHTVRVWSGKWKGWSGYWRRGT